MGSRTRERERTTVAANAAKLARRLRGDLQALHRLYEVSTESYLGDLAHDIEVALANECIARLRLGLVDAAGVLREVYDYEVSNSGDLVPAPHSGRFEFNSGLQGSSLTFRLTPSRRPAWEQLKKDGRLRIGWTTASDLDTSGMGTSDDGAYTAGNLALIRRRLTRKVS